MTSTWSSDRMVTLATAPLRHLAVAAVVERTIVNEVCLHVGPAEALVTARVTAPAASSVAITTALIRFGKLRM
jgi:hypothetical protein